MVQRNILGVAFALSCLSGPGLAATAHNSQAGAYGGTSNNCAATAYFAADSGCLSSGLKELFDEGDEPLPRQAPRHRRALPPEDDEQ